MEPLIFQLNIIVKCNRVVEFDNTKPPKFNLKDIQQFVLDNYWLNINFMTREKDFYEALYRPNVFVKKEEKEKYFTFQLVMQIYQILMRSIQMRQK